jgi:hypothetical protein
MNNFLALVGIGAVLLRSTGPTFKSLIAGIASCDRVQPFRELYMIANLYRVTLAITLMAILSIPSVCLPADASNSTGRWKINSVKICKSSSGQIVPSLEVIGNFPVYSFFIPRPVWTLNGNVVDAKPIYAQGRLVAFELMNAGGFLEHGKKNTAKFALPDHNGSRVFLFDHSRIPPGECYEFF